MGRGMDPGVVVVVGVGVGGLFERISTPGLGVIGQGAVGGWVPLGRRCEKAVIGVIT